jgi:hypothetical protein
MDSHRRAVRLRKVVELEDDFAERSNELQHVPARVHLRIREHGGTTAPVVYLRHFTTGRQPTAETSSARLSHPHPHGAPSPRASSLPAPPLSGVQPELYDCSVLNNTHLLVYD